MLTVCNGSHYSVFKKPLRAARHASFFSLPLTWPLVSIYSRALMEWAKKQERKRVHTKVTESCRSTGEMGLKLCLRCCCHFIQFYSILLCIVESILKENLNLLKTYSFSGHPRCRCVFFFTCSAMNPLQ